MRDGKTIGLALLGIVALIVGAVMLSRCQNAKKYDDARRWLHPALSNSDPFGYAVFDTIMAETLPNGYQVLTADLDSLSPKEWKVRSLLLTECWMLDEDEGKHIEAMVNQGCRVMVVTDCFSEEIADKWKLVQHTSYYFIFEYLKKSLESKRFETLQWSHAGDEPFVCHVPPELMGITLKKDNPRVDYLATIDKNFAVAVKVMSNSKGGALIVVTTPLLLTNYGILDDEISRYVLRLMEQISNRPVTRLQPPPDNPEIRSGHSKSDSRGPSFLSFFLSSAPLRAALYIALAALVLFAVMHARRKQRIIPVKQTPKNHSLEFVQIVGNIYYNRGDYRSLLKMKYTYFAEELRRRLMIDINDHDRESQNMYLLAQRSGMEQESVAQLIQSVQKRLGSDEKVDFSLVQQMIDRMNQILSAI
ncbi:MAG: hypothetical protein IKX36_10260 [Prevotella sp.]|nr:hypothetical protein [Prevotella sp.]